MDSSLIYDRIDYVRVPASTLELGQRFFYDEMTILNAELERTLANQLGKIIVVDVTYKSPCLFTTEALEKFFTETCLVRKEDLTTYQKSNNCFDYNRFISSIEKELSNG